MAPDDSTSRDHQDKAAPRSGGLRDFWRRKKGSLFWWALVMALLFIVLWPSVIVTIMPGQVGVLYRRFLGGTEMSRVFQEGTHVIFPWDRMYIFDARLHEERHTLMVLNNRGLRMELDVTVIYHPLADNTPVLLTTVGTDYREKLVIPMLTSSVRDVAAKYDTEDFFSAFARRLCDEMLVTMISTMGRNPVVIDNLLIRQVHLPDPLAQAINSKLVAQQKIFEQQFVVQQAAENFKRKYIDASAVSMTQQIVNERLSEAFLRWQGIEATRALAESGNSKVVLFGGKDGLPIILNLEGQPAAAETGAPAAEAGAATGAPAEAGPVGTGTEAGRPVEPTATTGPGPADQSWLDTISPDRLEQLSRSMEQAIGLPLYNHGPNPARPDRQGGQP